MTRITASRLRELFFYDPQDGSWTRLIATGYRKRHKSGPVEGYKDKLGRIHIRADRKLYLSSRLAWLYQTGDWPKLFVDHKDGNPSNNRWNNLREATHTQNMRNRKPQRNVCGYKGVFRKNRTFRAKITVNYRPIYLGRYKTAEEAALAYNEASKKYHGEFGRQN